ncbi:hypothetical protein J6590_065289 [Homalodisca vitripennis]|nr:hypothetical protein J6590_065289 [Homalodisca vitripennis]
MRKHGHDILRLPPYQPELNAIELIWADRLVNQKFETITETDWKKICENVKKMEEKFIRVQSQLEDTIESFVIDLGAEYSEEDNSDFSEDDIEDGNLSGIEELI